MPRPFPLLFACAVMLAAAAAAAVQNATAPPSRPELSPPAITTTAPASSRPEATLAEDAPWPRTHARITPEGLEQQVIVYPPQVDSWEKYAEISFRCALAVHRGPDAEPVYGVVEARAATSVDNVARRVLIQHPELTYRFPNVDPATAAESEQLVSGVLPQRESIEIALDRVLAYIDAPEARQREVAANLDPPPIFYSNRPAILVLFNGDPEFKPITDTSLMFAVNANWDVIVDPSTATSYLLYGESWMKTRDLHKGPWEAARSLPSAFEELPKDAQWEDVRAHIPGKPLDVMPVVFMSRVPAEIIVTDGDAIYETIPGIRLKAVRNTESALLRHTGDMHFYLLAAGRWFRARSLEGPWASAMKDLPPDFKQIPRDNEWAYVLASVPGTDEATDAVMLASVPRRATISVKEISLSVAYDGTPKFTPIPGTTVERAVNTTSCVLLCDGKYYACESAVWFMADTAQGPWRVCTSVPQAIYAIPPSDPAHPVTYVDVLAATGDTVETAYTSGYDNALVTAGVLVLGAGVIAAVANADDVNWRVSVNGNTWTSFGNGAFYNPGYGAYCRGGAAYGPYAGARGVAAYNPATGSWARRGGTYGAGGVVGARAGDNAFTNTYGAQIGGANRYGAWSRGVAARGDDWAAGGRQSGARGSAGWGGGQGTSARSRDGDLYVGRNGNVYRRDGAGNWQERGGGGWKAADANARAAGAGQRSLDADALARGRGIAASNRTSAARGAAMGGRSRGSGGRGGRGR